ncbi:hypothetical protein GCM10028778_20980 [Barrientosiimonas marina]|uniref:Uncharacterized protein n=1 Tax=Lentibacillus kimchii TaxID=1542911 RepID=A0ABW2UXJ8_9BACI
MKPSYSERAIQRYYRVLTTYVHMASQIECCASEDKAFYQDVCVLLARKLKAMQAELTDQGFVLCQGKGQSFPCEKEKMS